jgi:hypothetical protein
MKITVPQFKRALADHKKPAARPVVDQEILRLAAQSRFEAAKFSHEAPPSRPTTGG